MYLLTLFFLSGDNVEEAFLKTAKLIYQSVKDGKYVMIELQIVTFFSAEIPSDSGVQRSSNVSVAPEGKKAQPTVEDKKCAC
jgi:hypothetical protein